MEAAATLGLAPTRELPGDKASRIVDAMRTSVAARGIAGATFDHVASEAGVSRGLLHYYFGSKERLLIEVLRRECQVRIERLEEHIADASTPEDVLAVLVKTFEDFLGEGPAPAVMFLELSTLAQRNEDIGIELADVGRRMREHFANALRAKSEAGVLSLRADPEDISTFLFALADGVTVRRLVEPNLDIAPVINHCTAAARALLS
jgi:AcrR family transcriptional regulator